MLQVLLNKSQKKNLKTYNFTDRPEKKCFKVFYNLNGCGSIFRWSFIKDNA